MRTTRVILALSLVPLVASCDAGTEPETDFSATFDVQGVEQLSIDAATTEWRLSGPVHVARGLDAYQESSGFESPVIGLLMAPEGPHGRQVFIGLLANKLEPGTYRVRNSQIRSGLQLYGTVLSPVDPDGNRRHHSLTTGTLTITSTVPLRGSFALSSTEFFERPDDAPVGHSAVGQPGLVDVVGEIGDRMR